MAACPQREKYRCDGDCFICQPHWKNSSCPWYLVWKATCQWVFLELFGGSNPAGAEPRVHASGWWLRNAHVQSPTTCFTAAKVCLLLYLWREESLFQKYRTMVENWFEDRKQHQTATSPMDSPTSGKIKDSALFSDRRIFSLQWVFWNSFLSMAVVGLACLQLLEET